MYRHVPSTFPDTSRLTHLLELDPRLHLSQLVHSRLPHSSRQTALDSMSGSETLHAGSALGISSESLSYLILMVFGDLPTALRYVSSFNKASRMELIAVLLFLSHHRIRYSGAFRLMHRTGSHRIR